MKAIEKYILTVTELRQKAVKKLGALDQGTYDSYMIQAQEVARQHDITKPLLGIDIVFKEGAHPNLKEMPYPITKEEWEVFVSDARRMCEQMPDVYVIDGAKFSLPI